MKLKSYPEYKDSGVPWLGEIPKHWQRFPLRGFTRPKSMRGRLDLPLLSVYRDYGVILRASREDNHNPEGADLSTYKVVSPGDLVLNKMKTWQGSLGVAEHAGIVSPAYIVCSLVGSLHGRFLHHLLRSRPYIDHYNRLSFGVRISQWDMRYDDFKQIPVYVPPLDEQRAIASFVDAQHHRINHLIRAKRRLVKLLNDQKQVIVHRAVSRSLDPNVRLKPSGIDWLGDVPEHWEVTALRIRYAVQLGKMLDAKRITGSHLVLYLRNTDVQWDRINSANLPMMDILEHEYERYLVKPGDLLVCEGGDVGRSAFWDGALQICGYQKALHRLRPTSNGRECPRFLFYVMFAASKRGIFIADGSENTIAHLTAEKLRRHRFAFPPRTEQEAIACYLDITLSDLEQAVERATRAIDLLREYRTRLIADVVTGKLDVRGVALPALDEADALDDMDTGEDAEVDEMNDSEEATDA